MDVFALAKVGIKSAVATMGTALTDEHKNLLRLLGCQIRFCLDGDNAGQVAQMRIIESMKGTNLPYVFVNNTNNTRNIAYGNANCFLEKTLFMQLPSC